MLVKCGSRPNTKQYRSNLCKQRRSWYSSKRQWKVCFSMQWSQSNMLTKHRFDRLERIVDTLTRRVDELESGLPGRNTAHQLRNCPSPEEVSTQPDLEGEATEQAPAPLFVLRDVTAQSGFRPADRTATNTPSRGLSDDIILRGLISEQDVLALLSLFQEHYGRWVSFSTLIPTAILLEDVRVSPLLLCACCLIAVRHTRQDLATQLAPILFKEAKTLLSVAMLSVPQPIEFFQASLVLSMWSTTIGQTPLTIDSWLLSGFALQHSIASGLFHSAGQARRTPQDKRGLDHLCVWNHLCLVHLQ
jgi:hypothetical protein